MHIRSTRRAARAALLVLGLPASALAQGLDLTINHVGLGLGDVPEVTGLRLNFRDRYLQRVDGMNVTIWNPYDDARPSVVRGIALGLPITGAGNIDGLAVGLLGVGAKDRLRGVGIGVLGLGSGGSLEGIMVGGLGAGSGGSMTGIGIGGLGLGSGGKLKGIFVGGLGVGSGEDAEGLLIGGVGVGAGGDLTGITIAGVAAGAGGTLRGLTIAGIAAGAPRLRGVALSGIAAGGLDVRGVVFAAAWMRVGGDQRTNGEYIPGEFTGLTVSSFNQIRGAQHGLAIGIVNYAEELHGVQLGLINIARNNPSGARVLPVMNYHHD